MIVLKTTFADLELPEESNALLQQAMSELEADEAEGVKKLIKDRLLEIKRLEFLTAKAKTDLAELLQRDHTEILMLCGQ